MTALVIALVSSLCVGPPPTRRIDERVTRILELIRSMEGERISLGEAAATVFLSPGRLAYTGVMGADCAPVRYVLVV